MSNSLLYVNPNQATYYWNDYPEDIRSLLSVSGTSTQVEHLSASPYSKVIFGGIDFTISGGELTGGTVTSMTGFKDLEPHSVDYVTTGLSVPVSAMLGFVTTNDGLGLTKYLFAGNDVISNAGNDCPSIIAGYGGDDTITGGILDDIAQYLGVRSEYTVVANSDGSYSVSDYVSARDGTDTLHSVEQLQFSDGLVSIVEAASQSSSAVSGTSGNDLLAGGAYNISAGAGIDTVTYMAARETYSLTMTSTGYTVSGFALTDVERLQFSDTKLAIDLNATQSGGEVALLIGAVLGRASLANKALVGQLLPFFDSGATLHDAADALVTSGVMDQLAGGSSTRDYVNVIYHAVFNEVATPDVTTQLAAYIDSGGYSKADFLTVVAGMAINVDLVGLAQTGLEYS